MSSAKTNTRLTAPVADGRATTHANIKNSGGSNAIAGAAAVNNTATTNSKTASAITTAAAPATDSGAPTDAIIEELKALAQSMLDATNAARRRARTLESRRSYEALMNAIEGRSGPGAAAGNSASTVTNGKGPAAAAVAGGGGAGELAWNGSGGKQRHADPNVTAAVNADASSRSGMHGKPVGGSDEALTDVPISLSGSHTNNSHHNSHHSSGRKQAAKPSTYDDDDDSDNAKDDDEEDIYDGKRASEEATVHERDGPRSHDNSRNAHTAGTATTTDDDDNIFDGVKTQVFFRSTDKAAYNDVASSAWKPEQLYRAADGTTISDDSADDDDGSSGNSSSSSCCSSSSGSISSDDEGEQQCSSKGNHNNGNSSKKKGSHAHSKVIKASKPKRVYRVPLFPYGGGVTDTEALELSKRFVQCIRNSSSTSSSSSAVASRQAAAAHAIPRFIAQRAFAAETYGDIAATAESRAAAFKPQSPYEFVVEVERPVLFDAVKAREKRRREFRTQVKEGKAPVTMGTFNLRVIMDPIKTGFEDEKNFPITRGSIVADRYQIVQLLGKATFSRAVRCYDLHQPIYDNDDDEEDDEGQDDGQKKVKKQSRTPSGYAEVCLKIINNTKDFFDQSLDEIRLLTLINAHADPDEAHVIRLIDAFYYKEHTMLVTELLSDNLYEYSKYNREEEDDFYFTLPRLRRITRQITEALAYVHSLNLIHADLKPENVLFVSHRRCIVKVIDFGSSCFLSDHLSSYIQSRSYRAPEVVFGCDYDGRIDVWSLGAILAELVTGDVLFTSETVPEMMARIVYVCGSPFPRRMLWEGRHTCSFINKFGLIYESSRSSSSGGGGGGGNDNTNSSSAAAEYPDGEEPYYVYTPVPAYPATGTGSDKKKATASAAGADAAKGSSSNSENAEPYSVLRQKLAAAGIADDSFFSFLKECLTLDHKKRPTSAELLKHPFIADEKA